MEVRVRFITHGQVSFLPIFPLCGRDVVGVVLGRGSSHLPLRDLTAAAPHHLSSAALFRVTQPKICPQHAMPLDSERVSPVSEGAIAASSLRPTYTSLTELTPATWKLLFPLPGIFVPDCFSLLGFIGS